MNGFAHEFQAGRRVYNADIMRLDYNVEYNVQKIEDERSEYVLDLKAKTTTVAYNKAHGQTITGWSCACATIFSFDAPFRWSCSVLEESQSLTICANSSGVFSAFMTRSALPSRKWLRNLVGTDVAQKPMRAEFSIDNRRR